LARGLDPNGVHSPLPGTAGRVVVAVGAIHAESVAVALTSNHGLVLVVEKDSFSKRFGFIHLRQTSEKVLQPGHTKQSIIIGQHQPSKVFSCWIAKKIAQNGKCLPAMSLKGVVNF
jgi:hypothetical protein